MKVVRLKLKEQMADRNITQAKLVNDTQLAPNTVKAYFHEDVIRADLRVIAKLCEYLDCDIKDLMVLEDMSE